MRTSRNLVIGAAIATALAATGCRGSENSTATTAASSATTAAAAGTTVPPGAGSSSTAAPGGTAAPGTTAQGGAMSDVKCPDTSPGLTKDSIKLGSSYPLSGNAAAYSSIPKGVDAWFKHLNDTDGGFKTKDGSTLKIEWKTLDDQYSPPKSAENVKQLVEQDKVFLVLNPLGTPPNTAIREYMNDQKVPQMMVATGASKWGKEIDSYPWTIGYQPDYESEGRAYAKYILEQNPDAKIGVMYQNDDFGKDYLTGLKSGLGDKSNQIVSEVTYEPTDSTVDTQVSKIKESGADAFVVIAIPQFAIQAIQQKTALGYQPTISVVAGVSTSVAAVMKPAGFENGNGFVSSFYLKDPTDPAMADDAAIKQYREVLGKYYPDANADDGFHVFGMNIAQNFEYLIENMDGPLCRESIMAAVKNFSYEQPGLLEDGINVKTGPGDAFPVQRIQIKQFDGATKSWKKVGGIIDAAE